MASRVAMQQILCPTDYSECSRRALVRAIELAGWFEARVTVMHSIGFVPPGLAAAAVGGFGVPSEAAPPAWEDDERAQLERFVEPHLGAGVPIETKLIQGASGDRWREIQAEAEALPADLIVMGTHGRTGLDHVLVGSVTEKVLRVAPCPVLAVAATDGEADREPLFRRIVCATDLTAPSSPTVTFAVSLASENLARVTLLHVIEELGEDRGPDLDRPLPGIGALRRTLIGQARERLSRLGLPARTFCDVSERVETGRPWREILRVARESRADLIVVGAHTGGAFGRLLLGSNANQVIRHADCPVLVVRDCYGASAPPALASGQESRPGRSAWAR